MNGLAKGGLEQIARGPSEGAIRPAVSGSPGLVSEKPGASHGKWSCGYLETGAKEVSEGTLGGDFDRADIAGIQENLADAEAAAGDEVWGGYRYAVILDKREPDWLKVIDLGAGHSSSGVTLSGRVMTALKADSLLSESIGAGYIERHWPPALKEIGAWPLAGLRKSFLDGSLIRLIDPDATPRQNC